MSTEQIYGLMAGIRLGEAVEKAVENEKFLSGTFLWNFADVDKGRPDFLISAVIHCLVEYAGLSIASHVVVN